MPVYNGERYLVEQVESILAQDYQPVFLIALDDGSTDRSLDILRQLARREPRISVLRSTKNGGLITSIDRLLTFVATPYFALADQDDVWDRNKLRKSLEALHKERASLVYSDVRVIDSIGHVISNEYWQSRKIRPVKGRDPVPFIFSNPAIGHTIVAERAVAEASCHIPRDLRYYEAWIVAAACRLGPVTYIDDQLGSYRSHSSNVVGPKLTCRFNRLIQVTHRSGHLATRQSTRCAALAATAPLHSDLVSIATLFQGSAFVRLLGLRQFSTFILNHAHQIGMRAAITEIGAFALDSLATPSLWTGVLRDKRPRGVAGLERNRRRD